MKKKTSKVKKQYPQKWGTFSCIKESSDQDSNYSFEFKHFFGFCDFLSNLYIEFCDF